MVDLAWYRRDYHKFLGEPEPPVGQGSGDCLDCTKFCLCPPNYYMVVDSLWGRVNPDISGMLCLECLERRLGRPLHRGDFKKLPMNETALAYLLLDGLTSRSLGLLEKQLSELVGLRWFEACSTVPGLDTVELLHRVEDSPLFEQERRYASTEGDGGKACLIRFPDRIHDAPFHRKDAVIRHEIGHVVDLTCMWLDVEEWAQGRGFNLASTPERRADDIAEAIWGEKILYDSETVQSTEIGEPLRPEHLGL